MANSNGTGSQGTKQEAVYAVSAGNGGGQPKATPFRSLLDAAGATGMEASIGPKSVPRDAGRAQGTDLSRNVFQVGRNLRVGDFLRAVPKVFGRPVASDGSAAGGLSVPVQRTSGAAAAPTVLYDGTTTALGTSYDSLGTVVGYNLARLGLSVSVPKIDAIAAPNFTAGNQAAWRLQAASAEIVRRLNAYVTIGTGTELPVPAFRGLPQLCTDAGRFVSAGANPLEYAARQVLASIYPTDRGEGGGPSCLMGGRYMLRALMATASGQRGLSGWHMDARVGRLVYHYMGVPYYLIYEDSDHGEDPPTTGRLFAANLGPTGLCLVHAYGTQESMGIQIDEEATSAGTATQRYTVHGAYTLVPWENEAIFMVTDISLTF